MSQLVEECCVASNHCRRARRLLLIQSRDLHADVVLEAAVRASRVGIKVVILPQCELIAVLLRHRRTEAPLRSRVALCHPLRQVVCQPVDVVVSQQVVHSPDVGIAELQCCSGMIAQSSMSTKPERLLAWMLIVLRGCSLTNAAAGHCSRGKYASRHRVVVGALHSPRTIRGQKPRANLLVPPPCFAKMVWSPSTM